MIIPIRHCFQGQTLGQSQDETSSMNDIEFDLENMSNMIEIILVSFDRECSFL